MTFRELLKEIGRESFGDESLFDNVLQRVAMIYGLGSDDQIVDARTKKPMQEDALRNYKRELAREMLDLRELLTSKDPETVKRASKACAQATKNQKKLMSLN